MWYLDIDVVYYCNRYEVEIYVYVYVGVGVDVFFLGVGVYGDEFK